MQQQISMSFLAEVHVSISCLLESLQRLLFFSEEQTPCFEDIYKAGKVHFVQLCMQMFQLVPGSQTGMVWGVQIQRGVVAYSLNHTY